MSDLVERLRQWHIQVPIVGEAAAEIARLRDALAAAQAGAPDYNDPSFLLKIRDAARAQGFEEGIEAAARHFDNKATDCHPHATGTMGQYWATAKEIRALRSPAETAGAPRDDAVTYDPLGAVMSSEYPVPQPAADADYDLIEACVEDIAENWPGGWNQKTFDAAKKAVRTIIGRVRAEPAGPSEEDVCRAICCPSGECWVPNQCHALHLGDREQQQVQAVLKLFGGNR